ncbi:MAG: alpha/beta fold hydrolase [Candidatus Omnitrophota bacterium]|nr:alpha/beta fold hydrolase [Candidatus Omnitrophota bacterium]
MSVVFSFDIRNFKRPPRPAGAHLSKNGLFLKGHNGSAVILIHGLTGTSNEMKSLASFLHRKGYTVICPRLANHGESIWVLKNTKWQEFYETVRNCLLKGELAGAEGPIFASGLSMGALLALLLAHEFKDRVLGVSCLAPTLFYDGWNTPNSKFFLPLGYRTFLKHFFYFKEDPPYGIKNEIIRQRIHRYYNNARLEDTANVEQYGYPYFPVALLHQLQLLVRHLTDKLPDMRFPVQLIQAKDDDMASVRNSKFIYDRISSETKEMILLYDSYHVITADHERDTVAEKMEGFFGRVRRAWTPEHRGGMR